MIGEILAWGSRVLSAWWIWLPVVLILLFLTFQNRRRIKRADRLEYRLLSLEIPRGHEHKGPAAEELFTNLHNILRTKRELATEGSLQDHLAFEIAAIGGQIRYFIWAPAHLQSFVESQIAATYPEAIVRLQDEDYADRNLNGHALHAAELNLTHNEALPIKTYGTFDSDPLTTLHGVLAKLEKDEELWIQVLARPVDDLLVKKSARFIHHLHSEIHVGSEEVLNFFLSIFRTLWEPPKQNGPKEPNEKDKARIAEAEQKSAKQAYQTKIRLAYVGRHHQQAHHHIQGAIGAFKQFNRLEANGFSQRLLTADHEALAAYRARFFIDKGFLLNTEELATLFHLPYAEAEEGSISWADMKAARLPDNLPKPDDESGFAISLFGITRSQTQDLQFGINRADRSHHIYVTGLKGGGKTKLLELLALSDLYHSQGYAIFDPHGQLAVNNLRYVPAARIKDIVYFNAADGDYPIAFNPLETIDPSLRSQMATELIAVFKKTLFKDHWQPQLEYILRCTIIALLEYSHGTLYDVPRMLTDSRFRVQVLEHVTDPVVLNFWRTEFDIWNAQFRSDATGPIVSRMGAFISNPLVRNIVSQETTSFDFRRIMDSGQIFIANLASEMIGEENASVLGAMLMAKMHIAGLSRTNGGMTPRPFYAYIDDLQYFATDSFGEILASSTSHGAYLTISNQRPSLIPPVLREAVFGNLNTVIAFRLYGNDCELLRHSFNTEFDDKEITELPERHFVVSMFIDGQRASAFTGRILTLPQPQQDYLGYIIEHVHTSYGHPRNEVERHTHERLQTPLRPPKPPVRAAQAAVTHTATKAPAQRTVEKPRASHTVEATWRHHKMPPRRTSTTDGQEMIVQIRR